MLVVDLSCMSSIEKCKIGDLVMIIGEVDVHSWAHRLNPHQNVSDAEISNNVSAEAELKPDPAKNPLPSSAPSSDNVRGHVGLENVRLLTFTFTQNKITPHHRDKHNPLRSTNKIDESTRNGAATATARLER